MKKNKLPFLVTTLVLALTSLGGCGGKTTNSSESASNEPSNSEISASSSASIESSTSSSSEAQSSSSSASSQKSSSSSQSSKSSSSSSSSSKSSSSQSSSKSSSSSSSASSFSASSSSTSSSQPSGGGGEQQVEYRVVGLGNHWDYGDSNIKFVDATNPAEVENGDYVSQLKANFNVEADDEFKVFDGGDDWIGAEVLEFNKSFLQLDNGNIKAREDGSVDLYFKTYKDDSRGLAIGFTLFASSWPTVYLEEVFDEWNTKDVLPRIKNAAITEINVSVDAEEKTMELELKGGAAFIDSYEALLEAAEYEYNFGEDFWLSPFHKVAVHSYASGNDLFIDVGRQETIDYKLICTNDWDIYDRYAVFYAWVWGGTHSSGEHPDGEWKSVVKQSNAEYNKRFELNEIDADAVGMKIVRMDPNGANVPSFDAKWNETDDINLIDNNGATINFSFKQY